jgi:hypothetical protein
LHPSCVILNLDDCCWADPVGRDFVIASQEVVLFDKDLLALLETVGGGVLVVRLFLSLFLQLLASLRRLV